MEDPGCLQTLHDLLFDTTTQSPPVFIAIDFQGILGILSNFRIAYSGEQAGISILDTQLDLRQSKISSFNFIVKAFRDETSTKKAAQAFRFGCAEVISSKEMLSKILHCFDRFHDRRVVLVGHDLWYRLNVLKRLGLFEHISTKILGELDTAKLAENMQLGSLCPQNVLVRLGCPLRSKLGNAGNDANFTLRALLLLGVRSAASSTKSWRESPEIRDRADLFRFVATKM